MKKKNLYKPLTKGLPCFYCSADSTELKVFLILTIGGLALSSVFVCIGAWLKGSFKNTEQVAMGPLSAEKIEDKNV